MNEFAYSQFVFYVFGSAAMASGGMVIAVLLVLMLFVSFRDKVNFDKDKQNASPPRSPDNDQ